MQRREREQNILGVEEGRKMEKKKIQLRPMLLTNNQRKMHGLPMRRKRDKRKRFYTRCEADETIKAFVEWCNQ